jgi:hypothetical protein
MDGPLRTIEIHPIEFGIHRQPSGHLARTDAGHAKIDTKAEAEAIGLPIPVQLTARMLIMASARSLSA